MNNEDISGFYDAFIESQYKKGINDRIYNLYQRAIALGLNSRSNWVELGCGIGAFTFLLSKTIKQGKAEAIDISPKSIAFAQNKISAANISFAAADVVSYIPQIKDADFISLFDILEHIPIEQHKSLFETIGKYCNDHTLILINIPNPEYIEYDISQQPEQLQIIDQPVPLSSIISAAGLAGLTLTYFETHSIWVENDYQFMICKKKTDFKETHLSDTMTLLQKIRRKINRLYVKNRYRF